MNESKGCSVAIVVMLVILALVLGVGAGAAGLYAWYTMNPAAEGPTQTAETAEPAAAAAAPTAADDRYAVLIPIEQTLRVEGPLNPEVVRDKLLTRRFELRKCYQKGIDKNPQLKGELSIQFTVAGSNGKVTAAVERHTQFPDSSVRDCILNDVKAWTFPGKAPKQSVVKFDILMLSMSTTKAQP